MPKNSTSHFVAPKITLTGWEGRIAAHPDAPPLSRRQTKALAFRVHNRAESLQYVDPDDLIRYVLTYADPTGEQAVRNVHTGRVRRVPA